MTDDITVSRELLRQLQSLCMDVRKHSNLRMATLAIPLYDALRAALDATCQDSRQVQTAAEWVRCAAHGAQHDVREIIADMQTAPVQEPVHKLIYPGGGKALFNRLWHLTCNAVATQSGMRVRTDVMPMREMKEFLDHLCVLVDSPPLPAPVQEPTRPDILEKLSYHALERDDLTLDDCLTYLQTGGWHKVRGRTEREMVLHITELLASAPQPPQPVPAPVQEQQFTADELDLMRQWFESMQDTNRSFVIDADKKLHQKIIAAIQAAPRAEQPRKAVKLSDSEILAALEVEYVSSAQNRHLFLSDARTIEAAVWAKLGVEP